MRLLALLEDPRGPSARLRFEPFARQLESLGHEVSRIALPRSGIERWRLLASARSFDVCFLQRRLLQPFESALLRARARRLVVDVDDAIWRRDRAPHESWTRRIRARALLRRADAVLAGSRTLAAELATIGIVARALPTPVPEIARVSKRADERAPALVWIGQPSTLRYLLEVGEGWRKVRASRRDVRLLVVGGADAPFPAESALAGAETRTWSPAAEAEALAEAHVGLAPLPDDPWTRGKCGARALTCLAAGLPVVASAVGAQRELAEEVGGIVLASDANDSGAFFEPALALLDDPDRRRRLAEQATQRLAETRSVAGLFPAWLDAVSPGESSRGRAARSVAGR